MITAGAVAYFTTAVPDGTGPIFLDNVQCTGTESRIIDCPHNGVGTHNCAHSEDVGVRCQIRKFLVYALASPLHDDLPYVYSWMCSRGHQTGWWCHQQ